MKRLITVLISLIILLGVFALPVSAETPYDTYTYSYSGKVQISPAAYAPETRVSDFGEFEILNSPGDIFYDSGRDYIFIADTGKNRVIVTDKDLNPIKENEKRRRTAWQ